MTISVKNKSLVQLSQQGHYSRYLVKYNNLGKTILVLYPFCFIFKKNILRYEGWSIKA